MNKEWYYAKKRKNTFDARFRIFAGNSCPDQLFSLMLFHSSLAFSEKSFESRYLYRSLFTKKMLKSKPI